MAEPFLATTATVVGTQLLRRTVDDLYEYVKDRISLKIDKAKIQRRIPDLVNRINSFRMVKTLWQMERPVDIEDFYCASYVTIPRSTKFISIRTNSPKQRRKIDSVSDFGDISNIAIKGIAGQGKSIFLRHLFIREFELGQRIPIFIELRKIQKGESLLHHIAQYLEILDLDITPKLFRILSNSGKFVFFLDAFDEVPEEYRQNVLNELEHLAGISTNCPFLVTTRPDSGIEMSSFFTLTTLDNLRGNEYRVLIRKLSSAPQLANTLIKAIEAHKETVAELLCTPLLVTLLIIQYTSFQKLPEQMSDFYESIFSILLYRHDRSKPGFVRQRRCPINDNQYRTAFDAFCFESLKLNKSQFSEDDVYRASSRAMSIINLNDDPHKFLDDIIRITCLLLREGDEYRFIHNSVQEYYAASFIKSRPEGIAQSFYDTYVKGFRVYRWRNVLAFLSEIDRYRYTKYCLLPLCRFWLKSDDDYLIALPLPIPTPQQAFQIVGPMHVTFARDDNSPSPHSVNFYRLEKLLGLDSAIIDKAFNMDYGDLASRLRSKDIKVDYDLTSKYYYDVYKLKPRSDAYNITFEQLLNEGIIVEELKSLASMIFQSVYTIWRSAYDYLKSEDSCEVSIDFSI